MTIDLDDAEVTSLQTYVYDECRISIFADVEHDRGSMRSMAQHCGGRIVFCGDFATGIERLCSAGAGDIAFVTVNDHSGIETELLLDRLEALATSERLPVLVDASRSGIDRVAARLQAPSTILMCEAHTRDWIAAFAIARTARALVLNDVATDDSVRLQRLADEVQRIAKTLADLVERGPPSIREVSDAVIQYRAEPAPASLAPALTGEDVRRFIRLRRMRDRYFNSELFADPAWDMLLDLTAARIEQSRVSVSSLCIAAAVPPTTALRWIKTMCDNGMFVRVADPDDGRRIFIEMSQPVSAAMMAYLTAANATGALAV